MPKPIRFTFDGDQFSFQMNKIDRSKLYGFKETIVHDDQGRECELATLAEDGRTLIGKGGTGIGQLTADGKWTDKSKLVPVDVEGNQIQPVPSSFAAAIPLKEEVSLEEFLDHNIRLVYRLEIDESAGAMESLFQRLKEGAIFSFPYSYRGGLEADSGFLLFNDQAKLFFVVGNRVDIRYANLQQIAVSGEPEMEPGDDSALDFGMM